MNKYLAKGFSLVMVGVLGLFVRPLSADISARATLINWLNAIKVNNEEKALQYSVLERWDGITSYTILKEDPQPNIGNYLHSKDWKRQSLDSLHLWLTWAAAAMDTAENIEAAMDTGEDADRVAWEAMAHESYEKSYEKLYRERYGDLPDSLSIVTKVFDGSFNELAGLKKGDILLTFDGRPVYFYELPRDPPRKRTLFGELFVSPKKARPEMVELVVLRAGDTISIRYPGEGCNIPMASLKETIKIPSVSVWDLRNAAEERAGKYYKKCQIFGVPNSLISRVYRRIGELRPVNWDAIQYSPYGMMGSIIDGMKFALISQGHPDAVKAVNSIPIGPEALECMGEGVLVIRNKTFDVKLSGIFQDGAFKGLPWTWNYDIWVARCDRVVNGETIPGKWLVIGGIEWEGWEK